MTARWTVQTDWRKVVRDFKKGTLADRAEARFWVSVYPAKDLQVPPIHGSVQLSSANTSNGSGATSTKVTMDGGKEFRVEAVSDNSFRISLTASHVLPGSTTVLVRSPVETLVSGKGRINTMDLSPEGEMLVLGQDNGELQVVERTGSRVRISLQGHMSDCTVARFFPSGQVVLSGSMDMQVKIWSALDGECPMTLRGHTQRITDLAIISRGRNVLSSARDGTIRLWECASGQMLRMVVAARAASAGISKMLLVTRLPEAWTIQSTGESGHADGREVDTTGKVVVYGCEDGFVGLACVASGQKLDAAAGAKLESSAVTAMVYNEETQQLLTGTEKGDIAVWDLSLGFWENLQPLARFRRNEHRITGACISWDGSFVVSGEDGTIFTFVLTQDGAVQQREEWIVDEQPVYQLVRHGSNILCCTRKGSVYRFSA